MSYQKKDGWVARPSFFWYDTDLKKKIQKKIQKKKKFQKKKKKIKNLNHQYLKYKSKNTIPALVCPSYTWHLQQNIQWGHRKQTADKLPSTRRSP